MVDKYKIMSDATMGIFDQRELDITGLSNGIDEYMKATCLELLEYMAKNRVDCGVGANNNMFWYKGECVTRDQLFENFL